MPSDRRHVAVDLARRSHLRQHARRDAEQPQQFVVPLQRVDVEQHRARRVADVGDVARAAGQLPDQPRVDGAERELAGVGARAARPARCRESSGSCSPKSRRRSAGRSSPGSFRRRRPPSGARSSRRCGGPARRSRCGSASPVSRSQTIVVSRWLVMPIAARSFGRTCARPSASTATPICDAQISPRVVLDPAGRRKDLREFLLRDRLDGAVVVEHDGARAGRALIEREDVRHGRPLYNARHAKRTDARAAGGVLRHVHPDRVRRRRRRAGGAEQAARRATTCRSTSPGAWR